MNSPVSLSQVYHMVRSGELPAIKVGGRGQWRVERARLEQYITDKYAETAEFVRTNPLVDHATTDSNQLPAPWPSWPGRCLRAGADRGPLCWPKASP